MAEVSTEFTGDNKRLITAYQQIQRENVKVREEMVKMKQAAMDVAKEAESGLNSVSNLSRTQINQFTGVALGLVSIGTAVHAVTRGYDEWKKKIEEIGQAARNASVDTTRMLAQQDELLNAPKITERLGSMKGVTRDQARAAFAGVASAGRSPVDRRLDLTEQVARVAPLGLDLGQMGAIAGGLSDIAPGASAADIADLSLLASTTSGGAATSLGSPEFQGNVRALMAGGAPLNQALAFALHAEERGAGAGFVKKAAAALKSPQLAKVPAGERIAALGQLSKGNRTRLFEGQARGFDLVDFGEIASGAERFGTAFSGDVVGGRVAAAQATREGRVAAAQQAEAARADSGQAGLEPEAMLRASVRERFTRQLADRRKGFEMFGAPRWKGWLDTAVNRAMFEGHLMALDFMSPENSGVRALGAANLTLGPQAVLENREGVQAISGGDVKNTLQGIYNEARKANARPRGPVDEKQHAER